jgi:hypothetical protein
MDGVEREMHTREGEVEVGGGPRWRARDGQKNMEANKEEQREGTGGRHPGVHAQRQNETETRTEE